MMKKIINILIFAAFWTNFVQSQSAYYENYLLTSNNNLILGENSKPIVSTNPLWIDNEQYNAAIPAVIYQNNSDTLRIFNDQIAFYPVEKNNQILNFEYNCDVGTIDNNGFYVLPNDTLIGYWDLQIISKKWGQNLDTINSEIFFISDSASNADTVRILLVGNSLTAQGGAVFAQKISEMKNKIVKCYGTKGTAPYQHEGNSGWTFGQYIDSTATRVSPFWKNGQLDISHYRDSIYLSEKFDIVYIMLGINDLISIYIDTANTNTIYNNCTTLIDAFIADSAKHMVVIANTSTASYEDAWMIDYCPAASYCEYQDFFVYKTHYFRKFRLIAGLDENKYSDSVYVSSILNLNRYTGYNKAAGGGVHVNTLGKQQIGESYLNIADYLYKNNTVPDSAAYFKTDGTGYWGGITEPLLKIYNSEDESMTLKSGIGFLNINYISRIFDAGYYKVSFYLKGTTGAKIAGVFSGGYISENKNPAMLVNTYQYYEFEGNISGLTYIFFTPNGPTFLGKEVTIKSIQFQKLN